ncbi:MAG: hypothetical protein HOQ09_09960, partial [Gemmatimonadaceae bacterium]|nr:hypothetical protein [Gemmatimonadaceae bacterium]
MTSEPLTPGPRDRWLLPVLAELLPPDALERLLGSSGESLWSSAVRRGLIGEPL